MRYVITPKTRQLNQHRSGQGPCWVYLSNYWINMWFISIMRKYHDTWATWANKLKPYMTTPNPSLCRTGMRDGFNLHCAYVIILWQQLAPVTSGYAIMWQWNHGCFCKSSCVSFFTLGDFAIQQDWSVVTCIFFPVIMSNGKNYREITDIICPDKGDKCIFTSFCDIMDGKLRFS